MSKYEALEKEFGGYLLQTKKLRAENDKILSIMAETEGRVKELHETITELNSRLAQKSSDEAKVQKKLERYFVKYKASEQELVKLKTHIQVQRAQQLLTSARTESQSTSESSGLLSRLKRFFKRFLKGKRSQSTRPEFSAQHAQMIRQSEFFDAEYYLSVNQDVAENGMDPAEHYLKFGAFEGRNPSQYFNSTWYLNNYPDVSQAGVNPLLHYITYGQSEGRIIQSAD